MDAGQSYSIHGVLQVLCFVLLASPPTPLPRSPAPALRLVSFSPMLRSFSLSPTYLVCSGCFLFLFPISGDGTSLRLRTHLGPLSPLRAEIMQNTESGKGSGQFIKRARQSVAPDRLFNRQQKDALLPTQGTLPNAKGPLSLCPGDPVPQPKSRGDYPESVLWTLQDYRREQGGSIPRGDYHRRRAWQFVTKSDGAIHIVRRRLQPLNNSRTAGIPKCKSFYKANHSDNLRQKAETTAKSQTTPSENPDELT
ncbi:hypothetical protein EDB84DRAFT_1640129 [Lactarius hengduanensis]|nr:hypothetical protein EDB84DRAFT_1640129 [Lactarius hengduanensis]